MSNPWPSVSVLMPLLNEAAGLGEVLGSLRDQDYEGGWELVAVDGGSRDGTPAMLAAWTERLPHLLVVSAPEGRRHLTGSLMLAAETATGKIVIRADAHTVYASDYLRRNVEALLETGADLVGGPMRPEGSDPFGRAVASVMVNRWVVGPAPYRRVLKRRRADTVYLGAIRRSRLLQMGLRRFPSGVAEDADLAYRIRKQGGEVVLDPAIRSRYRPRATPGALWRQFYRYGRAKAEMLYANRELPTLRPLAPLGLAIALVATLGAAPWLGWWWALFGLGGWTVYLAVVTGGWPRQLLAAATVQLSNGLGILIGLAAGPGRVSRTLGPPY
ncbi:MAG: glycosyltransferase [bacterium]|nr:glycosyltransferase [bacterium]